MPTSGRKIFLPTIFLYIYLIFNYVYLNSSYVLFIWI